MTTENILGKKIELLPRELKPNQIHCSTCSGIGWLKKIDGEYRWIELCPDCYNGVIDVCPNCGKPYKYRYSFNCENPKCKEKAKKKREAERAEAYKQRIDKAEKVESEGAFDRFTMLYSDYVGSNEGYFNDWDTFFDSWYEYNIDYEQANRGTLHKALKFPRYVFGTSCTRLSIDADNVLEQASMDLWEGAMDNISKADVKELQDFLDTWCSKQSGTDTYNVDYRYAVKIPWELYGEYGGE